MPKPESWAHLPSGKRGNRSDSQTSFPLGHLFIHKTRDEKKWENAPSGVGARVARGGAMPALRGLASGMLQGAVREPLHKVAEEQTKGVSLYLVNE